MATDAFTGTNGTSPPNANWTNDTNGMQIQSNRAVGTVDIAVNTALYTGAAFSNDHDSAATLYHGGTSRALLVVRGTVSGDMYFADIGVDVATAKISKRVSGSYSDVSGNLGAPTAGNAYKLEAIGTSLKLYENSGGGFVQMGGTQTDSAIVSGKPGIGSIATTEGWDDWTGTDLGGGGGGSAKPAHYYAQMRQQ